MTLKEITKKLGLGFYAIALTAVLCIAALITIMFLI